MEKSGDPEIKEPIKVSKLHFLIHPGFLTDPQDFDEEPIYEDWWQVLDIYLEHSKTIPKNELVLVFLHSSQDRFVKDAKEHKPYVEKIRQMRKVLGRRMIVFSGDWDIFEKEDIQALSGVIENIANGRGYRLSKDVSSEAYGETLGVCVEEGANNLNRALGLIKKTVIQPYLTEAWSYLQPGQDRSWLKGHKAKMIDDFDRIDFEE